MATAAKKQPNLTQLLGIARAWAKANRVSGLDTDEGYYDTLAARYGVRTATALTEQQRQEMLDHFRRLGWDGGQKPRPGSGRRRLATAPVATKIRALWLFLYALGEVRDPSEAALAAYVKRIGKVDDLHWLKGQAAWRVVESLKKWAVRPLVPAVMQRLEMLRDAHKGLKEISEDAAMRRMEIPEDAAMRLILITGEVNNAIKGKDIFARWWKAWELLQKELGGGQPDYHHAINAMLADEAARAGGAQQNA